MSRILSFSFVLLTTFMLIGLRTADGKELECDRPHEEYACGSACQTTCENLGKPCPIVNVKCNDACYCKNGYARNGDDKAECIPISKCPKKCN